MNRLVLVFLFSLLLSVSLFSFAVAKTQPPDPPNNPTNPVNDVEGIQLEAPVGLLTLQWETVSAAQEYRYQYWKDGTAIPEPGQKEETVTQPQSIPILAKDISPAIPADLSPGAKYFWHVRSCADLDTNGTIEATNECGEYGEPWSFTFLLMPSSMSSLSPRGGGIKLPITLRWEKVTGAESYLLQLPILPAVLPFLTTDEEKKDATRQPSTLNEYIDDTCLFTRDTEYAWEVASCLDANSTLCGPFKGGSFYTDFDQPSLSAPTLTAPLFDPTKPIPLISIASTLSWNGPACAYLYNIKIVRENDGRTIEFTTVNAQSTSIRMDDTDELKQFWQDSRNLDQVFSWQVTSCWANPLGFGSDCDLSTPSAPWKFRTPGAAPTLQKPGSGDSTKIPISLSWQGDGASYRYQVAKDAGFTQIKKEGNTKETSVEITYAPPDITLETSYWWRVRTCVDTEGNVCGPWSTIFHFSTFPLQAPTIPDNAQIFLTDPVTWTSMPAANAYQYRLGYACRDVKETLQNCVAYNTNVCPDTSVTRAIENAKIISTNSFSLPYCMGTYTLAVRSCLDKDCAVAEPPTLTGTPSHTITAIQPPSPGVGLVPCGRLSDEPATPYNEVEPCQPKHAGFLLQNLLDFILWKASLFVLLILGVITGATSYFSFGGKDTLKRIKTVFKSFFVGFLVLVFAWMFVNIVLMLFGFQFEFFGKWWEISF